MKPLCLGLQPLCSLLANLEIRSNVQNFEPPLEVHLLFIQLRKEEDLPLKVHLKATLQLQRHMMCKMSKNNYATVV